MQKSAKVIYMSLAPNYSEAMDDRHLDQLIYAALQSGLSMDLLEFLSRGLDDKAVAKLLGNASILPVYMKSRDIPYLA